MGSTGRCGWGRRPKLIIADSEGTTIFAGGTNTRAAK